MSSGSWKKFECPPDMLTVEDRLQTLQLTDDQARELIMAQIETNMVTAASKEERKAWATLKVQRRSKLMTKQIKEAFIEDFVLWLQGRSSYSVESRTEDIVENGKRRKRTLRYTPWGNKPITFVKGASEFLSGPVLNRDKVIRTLTKLECTQPRNIQEAWIYYKYLVRRVGIDVDNDVVKEQRFYNDYDYLEKNPLMVDEDDGYDFRRLFDDHRIVKDPSYTTGRPDNPKPKPFDEVKYQTCRKQVLELAAAGEPSVIDSDEYAALTPETKIYAMSLLRSQKKINVARTTVDKAAVAALQELLANTLYAKADSAVATSSSTSTKKQNALKEQLDVVSALLSSDDPGQRSELGYKEILDKVNSITTSFAVGGDGLDNKTLESVRDIKQYFDNLNIDEIDENEIQNISQHVEKLKNIYTEVEKNYVHEHAKLVRVFERGPRVEGVMDDVKKVLNEIAIPPNKTIIPEFGVLPDPDDPYANVFVKLAQIAITAPLAEGEEAPRASAQPHKTIVRELASTLVEKFMGDVYQKFASDEGHVNIEQVLLELANEQTLEDMAKATVDAVQHIPKLFDDVLALVGMGETSTEEITPVFLATLDVIQTLPGLTYKQQNMPFSERAQRLKVIRAAISRSLAKQDFMTHFKKYDEGDQWRMAMAYKSIHEMDYMVQYIAPLFGDDNDIKNSVFDNVHGATVSGHDLHSEGFLSFGISKNSHEVKNLMQIHELAPVENQLFVKNAITNFINNSFAMGSTEFPSIPPNEQVGLSYSQKSQLNKFVLSSGSVVSGIDRDLEDHMNRMMLTYMGDSEEEEAINREINNEIQERLHKQYTNKTMLAMELDNTVSMNDNVKEALKAVADMLEEAKIEGTNRDAITKTERLLDEIQNKQKNQYERKLNEYRSQKDMLTAAYKNVRAAEKKLNAKSKKARDVKLMMKINKDWKAGLDEELKRAYKDYEEMKSRHAEDARILQERFELMRDTETRTTEMVRTIAEDYKKRAEKIRADMETKKKNISDKFHLKEKIQKAKDIDVLENRLRKKQIEKLMIEFRNQKKRIHGIARLIEKTEETGEKVEESADILAGAVKNVRDIEEAEMEERSMQAAEGILEKKLHAVEEALSDTESDTEEEEEDEEEKKEEEDEEDDDDDDDKGGGGGAGGGGKEEDDKTEQRKEATKQYTTQLADAYIGLEPGNHQLAKDRAYDKYSEFIRSGYDILSDQFKQLVEETINDINKEIETKKENELRIQREQEEERLRQEEAELKRLQEEEERARQAELLAQQLAEAERKKEEERLEEMKRIKEEQERIRLEEEAKKQREILAKLEMQRLLEEEQKKREEELAELEKEREAQAIEAARIEREKREQIMHQQHAEFNRRLTEAVVGPFGADKIEQYKDSIGKLQDTLTDISNYKSAQGEIPEEISNKYKELEKTINDRIDDIQKDIIIDEINKITTIEEYEAEKARLMKVRNPTRAQMTARGEMDAAVKKVADAREKKRLMLLKVDDSKRISNLEYFYKKAADETDEIKRAVLMKLTDIELNRLKKAEAERLEKIRIEKEKQRLERERIRIEQEQEKKKVEYEQALEKARKEQERREKEERERLAVQQALFESREKAAEEERIKREEAAREQFNLRASLAKTTSEQLAPVVRPKLPPAMSEAIKPHDIYANIPYDNEPIDMSEIMRTANYNMMPTNDAPNKNNVYAFYARLGAVDKDKYDPRLDNSLNIAKTIFRDDILPMLRDRDVISAIEADIRTMEVKSDLAFTTAKRNLYDEEAKAIYSELYTIYREMEDYRLYQGLEVLPADLRANLEIKNGPPEPVSRSESRKITVDPIVKELKTVGLTSPLAPRTAKRLHTYTAMLRTALSKRRTTLDLVDSIAGMQHSTEERIRDALYIKRNLDEKTKAQEKLALRQSQIIHQLQTLYTNKQMASLDDPELLARRYIEKRNLIRELYDLMSANTVGKRSVSKAITNMDALEKWRSVAITLNGMAPRIADKSYKQYENYPVMAAIIALERLYKDSMLLPVSNLADEMNINIEKSLNLLRKAYDAKAMKDILKKEPNVAKKIIYTIHNKIMKELTKHQRYIQPFTEDISELAMVTHESQQTKEYLMTVDAYNHAVAKKEANITKLLSRAYNSTTNKLVSLYDTRSSDKSEMSPSAENMLFLLQQKIESATDADVDPVMLANRTKYQLRHDLPDVDIMTFSPMYKRYTLDPGEFYDARSSLMNFAVKADIAKHNQDMLRSVIRYNLANVVTGREIQKIIGKSGASISLGAVAAGKPQQVSDILFFFPNDYKEYIQERKQYLADEVALSLYKVYNQASFVNSMLKETGTVDVYGTLGAIPVSKEFVGVYNDLCMEYTNKECFGAQLFLENMETKPMADFIANTETTLFEAENLKIEMDKFLAGTIGELTDPIAAAAKKTKDKDEKQKYTETVNDHVRLAQGVQGRNEDLHLLFSRTLHAIVGAWKYTTKKPEPLVDLPVEEDENTKRLNFAYKTAALRLVLSLMNQAATYRQSIYKQIIGQFNEDIRQKVPSLTVQEMQGIQASTTAHPKDKSFEGAFSALKQLHPEVGQDISIAPVSNTEKINKFGSITPKKRSELFGPSPKKTEEKKNADKPKPRARPISVPGEITDRAPSTKPPEKKTTRNPKFNK